MAKFRYKKSIFITLFFISMKTKSYTTFILLFISFLSFASSIETLNFQDTKSVEGVFDGHEDYGYNFVTTNSDGSEHMMTFQNIKEELLGQFDLKSEAFIGKNFKITYQIKIKKTKDEYGFEDEEEILTITGLEAL